MKYRAFLAVAIFLGSFGITHAVSILTVQQGGTGVGYPGGFLSGSVLYGNGVNAVATSSALQFSSSLSRLTATYASTTALSSSGPAYLATSGGSVGVGTNSPGTTLELNDSAWPVLRLRKTGIGYWDVGAAGAATNSFGIALNGAAPTLAINSSGTVSIGLGTGTAQDAQLQVGSRTSGLVTPTQVLVAATLTAAGVSGHGFSDISSVNRAGDGTAHASYNTNVAFSGTANYDHWVGYQTNLDYSSSGTLTNGYGYYYGLHPNAGTITNLYGAYFVDPSGAGTVTNNYGVYVESLTKGATLNYAIYTAGTTKSYFGGNVGIGTTSPDSLLNTHRTSNGYAFTGSLVGGAEVGAYVSSIAGQYGTKNNFPLQFFTNDSAPQITLLTSGNVGIGTTAPGTKLMVQDGYVSVFQNSGLDTAGYGILGYTNGSGGAGAQQNIGAITFIQEGATTQSGNIRFSTANAGSPAERMRISAAGNVGIGATSPVASLTVETANNALGGWGQLAIRSSDAFAVDKGGSMTFDGKYNTAGGFIDFANIAGRKENSTDGNVAGYLQFSTEPSGGSASTEKMRITSAGNVGINTTNPLAYLNVKDASGANANIAYIQGASHGIRLGDGATYATIEGVDATNGVSSYQPLFVGGSTLTLGHSGTADVTINSSGNVGINATSPATKLHVFGSNTNTYVTSGDNALTVGHGVDDGVSIWENSSSGNGYIGNNYDNAGATLNFMMRSGSSSNKLNAMTIVASGNVGIGTTGPQSKLQVAGSVTVTGAVATGVANSLVLANNGSGQSQIWGLGADTSTRGSIVLVTGRSDFSSSVTAMTIDPNGNVGVGTTSPWRTLSVTGTVAMPSLTAEVSTGNALCQVTGGEIQVNAATTCLVSSKRFKHDIETLTGNLSELLKLRPVSYKSNGTNELNVGLIAEEVQKIDGRLISLDAKGLPQTVKYENLTAVIIGAVQEVETQVQEVIARITGVEKRLDEQQKEIDELKAEIKKLK